MFKFRRNKGVLEAKITYVHKTGKSFICEEKLLINYCSYRKTSKKVEKIKETGALTETTFKKQKRRLRIAELSESTGAGKQKELKKEQIPQSQKI